MTFLLPEQKKKLKNRIKKPARGCFGAPCSQQALLLALALTAAAHVEKQLTGGSERVSDSPAPTASPPCLCLLSPPGRGLLQEPLQGFLPGLPARQQVKGLKGPQ